MDGQQSYTGAVVSDVLIEQLHTLQKVIRLLDVLLGGGWIDVPLLQLLPSLEPRVPNLCYRYSTTFPFAS